MNEIENFLDTVLRVPQRVPNLTNSLSESLNEWLYSTYNKSKPSNFKNYFYIPSLGEQLEALIVWQKNYCEEHKNQDGSIIASSGNFRKFLRPGEFLYGNKFPEVEFQKKIHFKSTDYFFDNTFFHLYVNNFTENFPHSLVRYFFNVNPIYLEDFLLFFISKLNKINFYVGSKTVFANKNYSRADNTVFYIRKDNIIEFNLVIKEFLQSNSHTLNPELPWFVYRITNGIGFGENPETHNESFGSYRCRILAKLIEESIHIGVSKRVDWILQKLEKEGFDKKKFYLNPYSASNYDFSVIENLFLPK